MTYHVYGASTGSGEGSSFWGDAVPTITSLPLTGKVEGELVLVLDTDIIYKWSGTAWEALIDPTSYEQTVNKNAANGYPSLDADGLVPITQIPPAALERLVIVADQTARYALTTATVQNGDTVKQNDTGEMYFVKDDTKLNSADGYAVYTAGTASAVAWSGITSKPTTISGYGITDTIDQKLTGYTSGIGEVSATDSILTAVQKLNGNNELRYAGVSTLPTLQNNGDGSITVGSGIYRIYSGTVAGSTLNQYTVTGNTFTLTDNSNNYVVVNYNSGSPVLQVLTSTTIINSSTVIPVYTIYREGTELHTLDWDTAAQSATEKLISRAVRTNRFARETGLSLSETTGRVINISAGVVWYGVTNESLGAIKSDDAGSKVFLYYHSSGNWVSTQITQYNNTQYDNGTNLATLNSNRYAVNWIYRGIESENHAYVVLGTGDYTLTQAQSAQPPATPPVIAAHSILVGKIIVQKSASTATEVQSAFNVTFIPSTPSEHNDLTGIQGGTTNEYYHLTSAEYTALQNPVTPSLDSLSDVIINAPYVNHVLTYNGTSWVNSASPTADITTGAEWYLADKTSILAGSGTSSGGAPVYELNTSPLGSVLNNISFNSSSSYIPTIAHKRPTTLGRSSIPGGKWTLKTTSLLSGTGGYTFVFNIYRVRSYNPITISTTGTGTSRTVTASGGTPFSTSNIVASTSNYELSSYLETSDGIHRILTRVSDTEITAQFPTAFSNITDVTFSIWYIIAVPFKGNTITSNALGRYARYEFNTELEEITDITTTDYIGTALFTKRTTGSNTIYWVTAGTIGQPSLITPIPREHNEGTSLQGGTTNEYYHLTSAEYTALSSPKAYTVSSKTEDFTAADKYLYLVDTTGGAIDIQLPTPANTISIKIKDSANNANSDNITLVRAGTEKIEGAAASFTIDSDGFAGEIVSDGTDWFII